MVIGNSYTTFISLKKYFNSIYSIAKYSISRFKNYDFSLLNYGLYLNISDLKSLRKSDD